MLAGGGVEEETAMAVTVGERGESAAMAASIGRRGGGATMAARIWGEESGVRKKEDEKGRREVRGPARTCGTLALVGVRDAWERATRLAEALAGRPSAIVSLRVSCSYFS